MKRLLVLAPFVIFFIVTQALAESAKSLKQAKSLSAQTGKPILLEFVHED